MNPKSRMVIFAVTLLLGGLCAQAAQDDRSKEPWIAVTGENNKTYYLPKSEYDRFLGDSVISGDQFVYHNPRMPSDAEIAKSKKEHPTDFFNRVWPRWKLFKLPPKSEIERSEDAKKRYGWALGHMSSPSEDKDPRLMRVLFYNLDDNKPGSLQRGSWVKKAADAKKPAETPPPASGGVQKPAGVDDDVWAKVAGVGDKDKARYAQVLQRIKKDNAKEYEKLAGKDGAARVQKVLAAIGAVETDLRKANKAVSAESVYGELTATAGGKKSRLQVSLDEDVAAPAPVPGPKPADQAGQGEGGPKPDPKQGKRETNPVNIIRNKLAESPGPVGASIGARLAEYIINGNGNGKDKGDAFIAADQKDAVLVESIRKQAPAWVKVFVDQGRAAEVAQIYFVLGEVDKAPAWLADEPQLSAALLDKDAQRTKFFVEGMRHWTKAAPDERGIGQYSKAQKNPDAVKWVVGFLGNEKPPDDPSFAASAAAVAAKVLKDSRLSGELGAIAKSIEDRAEGPLVPGGTGGKGSPIQGPAKGFDFNSLFLRGGVLEEFVYQTGDKVSRSISIKMYTVKEGGQLVNKVGIFDVTNPADTFGQKFPITGNSETTFALDDRVAGMPKYTLKFEVKGSETIITFGREGNPEQMKTSVSDLYARRAQQAVDEGNVTQIGSKSYYVLGQGGAKGSLLFFPPEIKDRLKSGGDLTPEAAAEVNQRAPDGRNMSIPYKVGRDLGTVGGKPYHLEFNQEAGYWEVKDGAGDQEPAPGPATPASGSTTTVKTGGAAGDNTVPGSIAAVRNQVRTSGYELDPIVNEFNEDVKKLEVEIYTYAGAGKPPLKYWHIWAMPKEAFAGRNLPMPLLRPVGAQQGDTPDPLRVVDGHYISITLPEKTRFFDLAKPRKVETKDDQPQNEPFEELGQIDKRSFNISEAALLKAAISISNFPLKGKTDRDVEDNLKAVMKERQEGEAYTITGGVDSGDLHISFGMSRLYGRFFPVIDQPLKSAGKHGETQGPGHAFDFSGLPKDDGTPFKDPLELLADPNAGTPAETVTKLVKAEDDTAVLYVNAEKTRWYFLYKFYEEESKQTRRSNKAGWVFAKGDPKKPEFPTAAVKVKGIKAPAVPPAGKFRFAGDGKKGLWYGVKSDTINTQNATDISKNCLGPVIWWGMDEAAALSACQKDKL